MPYTKLADRDGTSLVASKHPLFEIWRGIIRRCCCETATEWPRYGGRGITICDRWKSFENFTKDMSPRPSINHSIDRINNDGNYEPSNCRWATRREQQLNTRTNVFVTFRNKTQTLSEWSHEFGIPQYLVHQRYHAGIPLEIVFTKGRIPKEHRRRLPPRNPGRNEAILEAIALLVSSGSPPTIVNIASHCGINYKATEHVLRNLYKQGKISSSNHGRSKQWILN